MNITEEQIRRVMKNYEGKLKTKPIDTDFGWHEQQGFDDEPSGWMLEGGEEAYYKAFKEWEDNKHLISDLKKDENNN